MNHYRKVSIIIPTYNERATIERVLAQVKSAPTLDLEKEIILIDDYSTDGTRKFLKELNDPAVKIFFQDRNTGKGGALQTGFRQATGDIVIIQDADLEYNPTEIQKVLQPFLNTDAQVVYGSRYLNPSAGLGFWHSLLNRLFTGFSNLLLRQKITDIMTCYKAFSRSALNSFLDKLQSQRFGFEPEVTARLVKTGYKILEVPISYNPRSRDQGKHMNFQAELECLWTLIKYSTHK